MKARSAPVFQPFVSSVRRARVSPPRPRHRRTPPKDYLGRVGHAAPLWLPLLVTVCCGGKAQGIDGSGLSRCSLTTASSCRGRDTREFLVATVAWRWLTCIVSPVPHPSPNFLSLCRPCVLFLRCAAPAPPIRSLWPPLRLDRAAAAPGAPPRPGRGPVMGDRKRAAGVSSSTLPPSKQFRTSAAAAAAATAAAVVAAHPPSDERDGPSLLPPAAAAPSTPAVSAAAGGEAVGNSPGAAGSSRLSRPQPASPASRMPSVPSGGRGRRGSGHGQAMAVDPPPRSPDGEPDEFDLLDNGYA